MTPQEGQQLFNAVMALVIKCYVLGLGIGLGVRVFLQGVRNT